MIRASFLALALGAALLVDARTALSQTPARITQGPRVAVGRSPIGIDYLRALKSVPVLVPGSNQIGALVAIPKGKRAEDFGLEPYVPGIARIRTTAPKLEAFGLAHPDLRIEIAQPLHSLLDRLGTWVRSTEARATMGADGGGVLVGVADTGLDVTHAEMRSTSGRTRVRWMLDYSLQPLGVFPDLENKFGIKDDKGNLTNGAVLSDTMIDELIRSLEKGVCVETDGKRCAPSDDVGHGTHVTGIASARGASGKYVGVAPAADIVFVRVDIGGVISNDLLGRAVEFMFNRADVEKKPLVANISLGADFGPHDGSSLFEQGIADFVGDDKPGRAIVAAAGNVGSPIEFPIHQSVHVTTGARMRVPVHTPAANAGSIQIWVNMRAGADIKVGLEGPDSEWIAPVARGHQNGKNTDEYMAGVIYTSDVPSAEIPPSSNSAVVVWQGKWPEGPYDVTLEGSGMAELYLAGLGDAGEAHFAHGVREGTVDLPATHPSIIAVGCTVNRTRWTSFSGSDVGLKVPLLDQAGGLAAPETTPNGDPAATFRDLTEGEICYFSSAGPTLTGLQKPEIAAPGALVISALSRDAKPGTPGSVFTSGACPPLRSGKPDTKCFQIDTDHAIANGTSMSSPAVAGVVALLMQRDPTLTQSKVLALLQASAHRFRGEAIFDDQAGPGEVDAIGALDALDQMQNGKLRLPDPGQSWLTLSSAYVPADGSTPVTAIVELRTAGAEHRADLFDIARLQPEVLVDGNPVDEPLKMEKRAPGVYTFVWTPPPGLGGKRATFGASFDGQPVVAPKTVPIAADVWNASYPSHATGNGCTLHPSPAPPDSTALVAAGLALAITLVRRSRATSAAPIPRRRDRIRTRGRRY